MNTGGDAAEQVVRMSLEGVEVAAKITGNGAKNIALLLAAVLKEEQKTRGKARLSSMLKSGKELKVFSVRQQDLKKFSQEAIRYGVLYCVLKDRNNHDENAMVDVIARAEDASKIQRITERFKLATIDTATVMGSVTKERTEPVKAQPEKDAAEREAGSRIMKPVRKEENTLNPTQTRTGKEPLSGQSSKQESRSSGQVPASSKPSVREKLEGYRREAERARSERSKEKVKSAAALPLQESAAALKKMRPKER